MLKINVLLILFFSIQNLHAANSLSYSGRLVQASGAPVTGPVNLRAELVYTNATSTVQCSQNLTSVALTKGVFHLKLDLNCTPKTLTQVLSETPNGESVAIRIIDQTNSKTYPLQAIHSVPFSKVAEQLPQMGASAGQALAWDGSKWAPTSVGTGNGTVLSVTAGTGLSGGTITTTGTIGIAAGGVGTTELANNSVTAAKINTGEITSTHISATANIPYSKLQIGVGEIPQDRISGLSTSMSALIEDVIADAVTGKAPSQNVVYDALQLKADRSNVAQNITAASVTGLTTPLIGSDATNKTYVDNSATTLDTRITNEVSTLNTSIGNKYDKAGGVITGDVTLNTQMLLKGGSNFVTVKANSGTSNYVMTLPTSAGTNGYVLQTDGAGVLSWVNPSSVVTGSGTVNSASITDGSIVDADINAGAAIAQSKIAGLTIDLANKEPNITAGTAIQYWRGNKTWSSLQADVQALILNNYVLGLNSAVVNTDSLSTAIGKLQGQINATNTTLSGLTTTNLPEGTNFYFSEPRVLGTDLLGFDNTLTGQIAATDSVLQAFGRTQKQINDINTSISGNQWSAGSGNVYRTSGNVGIGTSTPTEKLEVNGTSKISGISFKRYSWSPLADTTDTFLFKTAPMANGNNAIIELKVIEGDNRITRTVNIEVRNAGGVNQVKVTPLIGSAGDLGLDLKYANANSNTGITEFYIYKTIPRMWTQSVIVSGSSISFDSTGLDPAALATVSLNTGLQVSSTGMVGIGTSNPTTKLQVVGGIIRSDLGATGQSLIVSGTGSNLQVTHDGGIHAAIYNSGGGIQFRSTDGVTNNVTILSSGNVGIGTATPTQKLEVNGNVKATQFCLGADCKSAWPVGLTSGSVTTTEILDGTIATADIADSAVSLVKLGGTRDATKYLKGDNTWSTFATDAINSVLSTFNVGTGTKPAVVNTDTIAGAFGKVQKTLNDINADYVSKTLNQTINGALAINSATGFITVPTPINPNDAANKAYVDSYGQWLENGANIYFNTGYVGIGLSTPSAPLEISSSSSAGIRSMIINNTYQSLGTDPETTKRPFEIRRTNSSGESLMTYLDDGVATVHYRNDEIVSMLNFRIESTDTEVNGGANASDLNVFSIKGTHTGASVGINTQTHLGPLTVSAGGAAGGGLDDDDDGIVVQNYQPTISFRDMTVGDPDDVRIRMDSSNLFFESSPDFFISSPVVTNKMTITSGGNVGIGTTSPGQKLSVTGVIESTAGGIKFPDGTTQTTAAVDSGLGENVNNPSTSCNALKIARSTLASGVYWLKPATSAAAFQAYCDMTTDGGGWTLVWSNMKGGKGKPSSAMTWGTAINTAPIYKSYPNGDLDSFEVYTGLKHWTGLAPGGLWRYDWKAVGGTPVEQRYKCSFTLTTADYIINLTSCSQLVGATVPSMVSYVNGLKFSAWDKDNDSSATNCAGTYTGSPFWYNACWSGSIWGGGEDFGDGHYPGAHWTISSQSWAATGGVTGAGYGWFFVK